MWRYISCESRPSWILAPAIQSAVTNPGLDATARPGSTKNRIRYLITATHALEHSFGPTVEP
jgi:hypothetical protein